MNALSLSSLLTDFHNTLSSHLTLESSTFEPFWTAYQSHHSEVVNGVNGKRFSNGLRLFPSLDHTEILLQDTLTFNTNERFDINHLHDGISALKPWRKGPIYFLVFRWIRNGEVILNGTVLHRYPMHYLMANACLILAAIVGITCFGRWSPNRYFVWE